MDMEVKMKKIALILMTIAIFSCKGEKVNENNPLFNELNPQEKRVIEGKGTEMPGTGKFNNHKENGTYICRKCNLPLYLSEDKFASGCGWPSFDDEIPGAVKRTLDADGHRIEITCSYCGAHLGHVFEGEQMTPKNTRHCVNSISMDFIQKGDTLKRDRAFFAAGCFWGVEHLMENTEGVLDARSGYMGGAKNNPSYEQVCTGNTGHAEAVEVIFDPSIVTYEELVKLFFEIHDFTQIDGQGPDIGDQYRSAVFYTSDAQREIAEKIVNILEEMDHKVATEITQASVFWPAEDYHQNYYKKTGKQPYCHIRRPIFD